MNQGENFLKELKGYSLIGKFVFSLDFLLASLIFIFSHKLISTEFGRASLIFGFAMLSFVTLMGILRKWN